MRGRPGCPTGQEKNPAGATDESLPFSTRKGWVPNRPLIRPGFAGPPSPRGEGFGGVKAQWVGSFLSQKCFPAYFFRKNASQIGFSIPEETSSLPYQRQRSPKRASGSKRAIKLGVQGACPRPSFSPFLGRNGDPRRAGGATGRCASRWLPRRPPKGYAAPCRP